MSSGLDPVVVIRERAEIVELVGEHVVLKRSGRNFMGLCPFHGEKTPSFNVNPERGIFKCFGCGEGGDAISFVMKINRLSFPETVKLLAERYGIPLAERQETDGRGDIRRAVELAARYFSDRLREDASAQRYLEQRGISAELAQRFGLGYAPKGWDGLHRYLSAQRIPAEVQEAAGLVRTRKSGPDQNRPGFYDYFRDRLIFPITTELGQVIAFGGRSVSGEEPKYLNSPDTPIYQKGRHLYGLSIAKEAIKRKHRAILMEGYMDVITAHQHGFDEAVGVLGTALTPQQAKLVLRFGSKVVVSYDADRAGQAATERGVATLEEVAGGVGLDLAVLKVPTGKDPDAFLRQEGSEAFAKLVEAAQPMLAYRLERAIGEAGADSSAHEKRQAVYNCLPILRRLPSRMLQDEQITKLIQRLDIKDRSLRVEINSQLGHNSPRLRSLGFAPTQRSGWSLAEQELFFLMVEHAAVRSRAAAELTGIPFSDPTLQGLREAVEHWDHEEELTWEALLRKFPGEQEQRVISGVMFASSPEKWQDPSGQADSLMSRVAAEYWSRELESIKDLLSAAMQAGAPQDEIDELLRQFAQTTAHIEELKSHSGHLFPNDSGLA